MTLQLYRHIVILLFYVSLNIAGRCIAVRPKLLSVHIVSCDSGPESESPKFYRLQLRLRLQTKRSTPTDSNSSLDSDSAALVLRHARATAPSSRSHCCSIWISIRSFCGASAISCNTSLALEEQKSWKMWTNLELQQPYERPQLQDDWLKDQSFRNVAHLSDLLESGSAGRHD